MIRKLTLAAILAASFGSPAAAQVPNEAQAPISLAGDNCVTRTIPWMNFQAGSVEDGKLRNVTGVAGGVLMRAGVVACLEGGIEATDVSFFPDLGVSTLLEQGSSVRIGKLRMDYAKGTCAPGRVSEMSDLRIFAWSRNAIGANEVVMRINGENIYRPVTHKFTAENMRYDISASNWGCAISGDIHFDKPVFSTTINGENIRVAGEYATLSMAIPTNLQEFEQYRDLSRAHMTIDRMEATMNSTSSVGSAARMTAELDIVDPTMWILYARKYLRPLLLPMTDVISSSAWIDASNVVSNTNARLNVALQDAVFRPGIALTKVLPGNYTASAAGILLLEAAASAEMKDGTIMTSGQLDVENLAALTFNAGIAPKRIGTDEALALADQDAWTILAPRQLRMLAGFEDKGFVDVLRGVIGYGYTGIERTADFFNSAVSGKVNLGLEYDPAGGLRTSVTKEQ